MRLSQQLLSHTVRLVEEDPRRQVVGGVTDSVFVTKMAPLADAADREMDTWPATPAERDLIHGKLTEVMGFDVPKLKIDKVLKVMVLAHVNR